MSQSAPPHPRDSRLVCVVDDNVSLLASYGALLESANFTVVPYPSGAMLLADDKYLRAGCVLLDLHMPPPDGLETLRRIQMQPNPPAVRPAGRPVPGGRSQSRHRRRLRTGTGLTDRLRRQKSGVDRDRQWHSMAGPKLVRSCRD